MNKIIKQYMYNNFVNSIYREREIQREIENKVKIY